MALPATRLQRAQGSLRVRFRLRDGATVLDDLYQQGCLKARFPRLVAGTPAEAVLINTAGGLTDGDDVVTSIEWAKNTKATVTTQAAERIYRCRDEPAKARTKLVVAEGAIGCWLPQETILFEGSRFDRHTDAQLAANSRFFAVETLVFGRSAMGEHLRSGSILDRWRIHVDGRLVLADAFRLSDSTGDALATVLQQRGALDGALCAATLIWVTPDPDGSIGSIKQVIESSAVTGGASNLGVAIIMRLLAKDIREIRTLILRLYAVCLAADTFVIPRVWNC